MAQPVLGPAAFHGLDLLARPGQPLLEHLHDGGGQVREHGALLAAEAGPRGGVDQAERAQRQAVWRAQGRARVETHVRGSRDERIVGEARVALRVGHDEHLLRREQDGVRAKGQVARDFAEVHAVVGFEPLAVAFDQGDQNHGHPENPRGQTGDPVEGGFRFRPEYFVAGERLKTGFFIGRRGRGGHGWAILNKQF